MYNEKVEGLIKAALADGELTEKEKQILFRKAEAEGIDLDEFEMVLDAKLFELKKEENAKIPMSAPKSDKFGDVRKCPVCGAIVASGTAVCVECGYAFTDSGNVVAMEKLSAKLEEIDNKYEDKEASGVVGAILGNNIFTDALTNKDTRRRSAKMQAIMTFTIPNTRAELLGLLTSVQVLANKKAQKDGRDKMTPGGDNLGYAYYTLFCNCINKAKISFANDKAFEPYIQYYEEMNRGAFSKLFGKK